MARRGTSNNVKAGVFVILAIVVTFAFVLTLAGAFDRLLVRRSPYTVFFPLHLGAAGIEPDSDVLIGGRPVGYVTKVELLTEPEDQREAGVYIAIDVQSDITFYGDPRAFIERPLLGSGASINFPSIGDRAAGALSKDGSATLYGDVAPPSFLAQAGYGDDQKAQVQRILSNMDDLTERARDMTVAFQDGFVTDANELVADARQRSGKWFDDADAITEKGREFADSLPGLSDAVRARVEEVHKLIADARAVINDNRGRIDSIIANSDETMAEARDLLASLNDETRLKLNDMLDAGSATLADARDAVQRVDGLVKEQTPNIRKGLANARMGTDQLRMALAEVRRSPWRLLYRPDMREVEFEILYDAARTYAAATSDLRDATESLEQVAPALSMSESVQREQMEQLIERFNQSVETYRDAEEAFLNLVIENSGE